MKQFDWIWWQVELLLAPVNIISSQDIIENNEANAAGSHLLGRLKGIREGVQS